MDDGRQGSKRRRQGREGGLPLRALERFLNEGMPVAAIAHSHHVDALMDPRVREDDQFQRFSAIELNELHHQVAALGALLRLQMGETGALQSLGTNLAGFLQNRQAALDAARRLPPYVASNPSVQTMMALIEQTNKQVAANWPVIQQVLDAADGVEPGPLVVWPEH